MAKILVVDDEEHIWLLYSEELSEAGYEVITAADGYKLTERIDSEKPDLVILDIKMIDYNGLDLLQEIECVIYWPMKSGWARLLRRDLFFVNSNCVDWSIGYWSLLRKGL